MMLTPVSPLVPLLYAFISISTSSGLVHALFPSRQNIFIMHLSGTLYYYRTNIQSYLGNPPAGRSKIQKPHRTYRPTTEHLSV